MTILFFWQGKRAPYLISGWLWLLFGMAPTLGLVFGDRFTYVPAIGLAWLTVWGLADIRSASPHPRTALAAAGMFLILALAVRSCFQVGVWRNSDTLLQHVIG